MTEGSPPRPSGTARSATGLLEQIAESALDDDYYVFRGSEPRRTRRSAVVVALVVSMFALLLTTAAVQTRNDRPATELERRTLAADIQTRQKTLDERRATVAGLQADVALLQSPGDASSERSEELEVIAATDPASGPGIVIAADDGTAGTAASRITDRDLQILVNGLWYAGAEAIAVDDSRIGTLTSIRTAGDAVTVNYRSISPPYRIEAVGDAEALRTRFAQNPSGAYWEKRQRSGVRFSVTPSSGITVPAVPDKRLELNHAAILQDAR